jgi:GTPase SAR1 family protein
MNTIDLTKYFSVKTAIVILLIGALAQIFGALDNIQKYISIPTPLLIFVGLTLGALGILKAFRTPNELTGLRPRRHDFDPFRKEKTTAQGSGFTPWPRPLAAKIANSIDASSGSHVIISGQSGAGKSTLLKTLVQSDLQERFGSRNYRIFVIKDYENLLWDLIDKIGFNSALLTTIEAFHVENRCPLRTVFDPDARSNFLTEYKAADLLLKKIFSHIDQASGRKRASVFVFDQFERFLQLTNTPDADAFAVYFFIKIANYLTARTSARTVFLVRADFLFQCYDFIEREVARGAGKSILQIVCPGINTDTDPEATKQVLDSFKAESSLNPLAPEFERITGLRDRSQSNTFWTQFCGYMALSYPQSAAILELLQEKKEPERFMDLYFSYVLNDYGALDRSNDSIEFFKAAVFAIAAENRLVGRPMTVARLARLVHVPPETAASILSFLYNAGLLETERLAGSKKLDSYRMVHDIISDYVLSNGQFKFDEVFKDGVRGLIEARAPTEQLTVTKGYVDGFSELIEFFSSRGQRNNLNFGLLFVWILFLFTFTKAFAPSFCETSYQWWQHAWLARSCTFVTPIYPVVALMHSLWAIFVYCIDRNYFSQTLKNPVARGVSNWLPPMAVLMAIYVSQSPSLYLLPIVLAGLAMSLLLVWGIWDGSFVGHLAGDESVRAGRTFLNMSIVGILMLVNGVILMDDGISKMYWDHVGELIAQLVNEPFGSKLGFSGTSVVSAWLYIICAVQIYFYFHIRPEQQSRISVARLLSQFDYSNFRKHGVKKRQDEIQKDAQRAQTKT